MRTVNVHEAKTQFSRLIDAAHAGETILVAKDGKPWARLVAGKSRITPDMALRLSRVLGRSAESWLSLQDSHDLWQARQRLDLSALTPMEFTPA